MNFTNAKNTEIYYLVDGFCEELGTSKKTTSNPYITARLFHDKGYKCIKPFYIPYIPVIYKIASI